VASAKEHARKEWKKIYGNGGDGLEATHVENISASGNYASARRYSGTYFSIRPKTKAYWSY